MVREYRVNPEKVHLELKEIFEKSEWKGINLRTEPFIINSQSLEELSLLPTDELRKEINKMYEEALIRKEGPTYYHKKRLVSVDEVIIFDENLPSSNPYRRLNLDNHVEREIARNFDRIKFEELAHGVQHITGSGDNKETIHLSDLTYEFKDKYGEGSSELKLIKEGDEYNIKVLYDDTRSEADIAAFFKEHNPDFIDDIFLASYPERKTIIDFVNREGSIQSRLPYSEIASGSMRDLIEGIGLRVHAGQKTLSELKNSVNIGTEFEVSIPSRKAIADIPIHRKNLLDKKDLAVDEVFELDDAERLYYAERSLERELSDIEMRELLSAHYTEVGTGYSRISAKTRQMQSFSQSERRTLMESGVVGRITENEINIVKSGGTMGSYIYRDPSRLSTINLDGEIYVIFENIRSAPWPDRNEIGNLPFFPRLVNPSRGSRISIFTESKLVRDGFYEMNTKQKREYLTKFGIRTDLSNREMIYFQLESGVIVENYQGRFGTYNNIIIGETVPGVRVLRKRKL